MLIERATPGTFDAGPLDVLCILRLPARLSRRALETAHAALGALLAAEAPRKPVHPSGPSVREARRLRSRYVPAAVAILAEYGAQTARGLADRLEIPDRLYRSLRAALSADAGYPDAWVRPVVTGSDLRGAYWTLTEEGRRVAVELAEEGRKGA